MKELNKYTRHGKTFTGIETKKANDSGKMIVRNMPTEITYDEALCDVDNQIKQLMADLNWLVKEFEYETDLLGHACETLKEEERLVYRKASIAASNLAGRFRRLARMYSLLSDHYKELSK